MKAKILLNGEEDGVSESLDNIKGGHLHYTINWLTVLSPSFPLSFKNKKPISPTDKGCVLLCSKSFRFQI